MMLKEYYQRHAEPFDFAQDKLRESRKHGTNLMKAPTAFEWHPLGLLHPALLRAAPSWIEDPSIPHCVSVLIFGVGVNAWG